MALYITASSDIEKIAKEIRPVLEKEGNQMKLYYAKNGPPFPDIILDYISDERIKIKRLPLPAVDCCLLLAYDIGKFHALQPDTEVVLWGEPKLFEQIYKLLIQYDQTIRQKVRFQSLSAKIPQNGKPIKAEVTTKERNKGEQRDSNGRDQKKKGQIGAARSTKENKLEKGGDGKKEFDAIKPETISEVSRAGSSKYDVQTDGTSVYKTMSGFQNSLEKITGESLTESQTLNIMMSILECEGIEDEKIISEIYQEKLISYFPSKEKAIHFWERTKDSLDKLLLSLHISEASK